MENRTQDTDGIVFHTERIAVVFGHICVGFGLFFFFMFGVSVAQAERKNEPITLDEFLIFCGILLMCLVYAIWLYRMARSAIVFDAAGLRLLNDGRTRYRFLPWSRFSYGYFRRNTRGFEFVVLSAVPLTPAKVKRAINWNVSLRIYYGDYVVFPCESITTSKEQEAAIREMIRENVPNITWNPEEFE